VIFPSLMIGIDQSIVSERRNTFGEFINGVLLCGSEHFESLSLGDNVTEVYRLKFNPEVVPTEGSNQKVGRASPLPSSRRGEALSTPSGSGV
jgi:hypothetical protein